MLQGFEQAAAAVTAGVHGEAEAAPTASANDRELSDKQVAGKVEAIAGEMNKATAGGDTSGFTIKENESESLFEQDQKLAEGDKQEVVQLSIFADETPVKKAKSSQEDSGLRLIVNMVKEADLMNMTPLEAMQLINDLKQKAKSL
ncbi:hypothetical protein D3C76_1395030 [compost metagenome]